MDNRIDAPWRAVARRAAGIAACLAFAVGLVLAGVARADDDFLRELKAGEAPPAGRGVVFGRLVLVEDGEEKGFSLFREMSIFVTSLAGSKTERLRFLGDGDFRWALAPGEYVVSAFFFRSSTGRVWTAFTVPEPGRAAYVGDLVLQFDGKSRGYGFGVRDGYEPRLAAEAAGLAAAKLEPVKSLMQVEARLGNYRRTADICNPIWGIECTRTFRGVEAVAPPGTESKFPAVPTLAPLLEWKPSPAPGATYDVAVYEALSLFGNPDLPGGRAQLGALVAYAEDIAEPRYQFTAPLAPSRRYFWSVRVRQGDAVSSWSTTGYFVFLLVAAASGSGGWFGFTTPPL